MENPYDALVLRETLRLAKLREEQVPEMFTPEEIARRKAGVENQMDLATLFKLSNSKNVANLGGTLLNDALLTSRERITEHGIYSPTEGKLSVFPEYTRRVNEARTSQDLGRYEAAQARTEEQRRRDAQAEQERKDRAAALEEVKGPYRQAQTDYLRAREALARQKQAQGAPMSNKAQEHLRQLGKDMSNLQMIRKKAEGYTQVTGVTAAEETLDWAARAVPGLTESMFPQAKRNQEIWADIQRLKEMKERHANFGATLTGNELKAWRQVSPPRGLEPKQLIQWIDEQKDLIERALKSGVEAAVAAGHNKRQIEALTRGLYTPPAEETAPEAPTAEPPSGGSTLYYDRATKTFRMR